MQDLDNIKNQEESLDIVDRNPKFPTGSKVLKVKHARKRKLDRKYYGKVYQVLEAYKHRSCLLGEPAGRGLKRHVNQLHLRMYNDGQRVYRITQK